MAKNINYRIVIIVFLIFFAIVFVAWAYLKYNNKPMSVISVGYVEDLNPLFNIALAKRYFNDEGVVVIPRVYSSGKLALNAMLNDAVDVAIVGVGPIVIESFNRGDFQILSSLGTFYNLYKIAFHKNSDIQSAQDLKGKKIAVQENSTLHYFLDLFLYDAGIKPDDVEIIFTPSIDDAYQLFFEKKVDAVVLRDPFLSRFNSDDYDSIGFFEDETIVSNILSLTAKKGFIAQNTSGLSKILKAMIRAQRFAEDYRADRLILNSDKLLADKFLFNDVEMVLKVSLDHEMILELERVAMWAHSEISTEAMATPNFLQLINTEPLEKADITAVTITK